MTTTPLHEFIAIDEGHATLLHINERDASKNWIVSIGQPQAHDMQLVGGNKILIGHHRGYSEFDITRARLVKEFPRGNIVWTWSKADLISSLQGVLVLDDLDTTRLRDERSGCVQCAGPA